MFAKVQLMELKNWLDQESGRASQMALHFKVTVSAITQWRKAVPVNRMREVRSYTKGAVDFNDMLPGAPEPANKRPRRPAKAEA